MTTTMRQIDRLPVRQFAKYCAVGVLNTAVTLGVIFVCKSVLGVNPYVSNMLGYVAGIINSFVWNKVWVFRSHSSYRAEGLRFAVGFGICYAMQFALVWCLTQSAFGSEEYDLGIFVISGYGIATLLGNVLYTICNFLYNKLITFSFQKP